MLLLVAVSLFNEVLEAIVVDLPCALLPRYHIGEVIDNARVLVAWEEASSKVISWERKVVEAGAGRCDRSRVQISRDVLLSQPLLSIEIGEEIVPLVLIGLHAEFYNFSSCLLLRGHEHLIDARSFR